MKTKNNPESERQKMLNLMIQSYGKLKDSPRVEFVNVTLKEIANELTYDTGQLSKILNPPSHQAPSDKIYRKVIQRLSLVVENKELKARLKAQAHQQQPIAWKKPLLLLSLAALLFYGWFTLNQPTNSQQKLLATEHVLTKDQRIAVMELYAKTVQYEMTLEGLIYHYSLHKGLYDKDTSGHYLAELYDRLPIIIAKNRSLLKKTKLRTEDGSYLEEIASHNTDNENALPKIFEKLTPNLTNLKLSPNDVVNNVRRDIEGVQQTYFSLMEEAIQKKLSAASEFDEK